MTVKVFILKLYNMHLLYNGMEVSKHSLHTQLHSFMNLLLDQQFYPRSDDESQSHWGGATFNESI